ncbi:MAG: type I secretion system permease/ATPase [Methyloceanibacter sp.]
MTQAPDEFVQALRAARPALAGAAIFSGAINLLYLSSPLYLMQIYNRVLASGSMSTLVMLTLALLVALLTMATLDAIRSRVLVRTAMRLDRQLTGRLVTAMVERGAIQGGNRTGARLRDFDQFRSVLAGSSMHVLFDLPWTPLFILLLFVIDTLLGFIALCGVVLLFGLAIINDRVTRARLKPAQVAGERAYGFADSMVRNADCIRAMAMGPSLTRRWQGDREQMLARQAEASDITGGLTATVRFFRLLLQAIMLAAGAALAIDHVILPATIFASSIIMSRALAPVEHAVTAWRQFGSAGEAALRLRKLLIEHPAPQPRMRLPRPEGLLTLEDVSCGAGQRLILKDVSFELEPGESLGIIGPSGAGKSTLARIIAGATKPASGKVKLGGVDLSLWPREDLGLYIGYMPDHVGLFAGSVRDNIARFTDISDEAVIAATKCADIHDMVLALPQGYDTTISDGGHELSGGQRQRIGVARALLGSPCFVVLDEPNAHLDVVGERALDRVIAHLKANNVTVAVVTHRPNVLAGLDKLLLLNGGTVEMFGPRDHVVNGFQRPAPRPMLAKV